MKFFNKLARDEQGATAIEYGLIAALIAVAAITAMQSLGNSLEDTFQGISTTLDDNAVGGASSGSGSGSGSGTGSGTA
ncbi:MAG: Flp family type IVb pilin [Pseudomonadota bacterium]